MAKKSTNKDEPVVVKKYANRRLYNTQTSTYVTLDDLCEMVKEGTDFIVCDAKSGDDLTRQVLTQIIFEQESRGENLLPIGFLRNLIGFYDDNIKEYVPHYLEKTMETFITNQEKMREMMGMNQFGNPLEQLEEIGKQNMEFFSKTMGQTMENMENMGNMFNPFTAPDNDKK
ncbi:MAG: polyhydroxyalkanoate synthesis repressor PhaR [Rickettsiales bacterium]|nr:polyhydroxyalkanoate synthesis repressor PhaR [Rickettsiales bacterium]